tara:strand:- start:15994 stop:16950 length:957 start_codon:yes stop_codon:yes gene_type:complete
MNSKIPFVEKYRPTNITDIVLSLNNREIINNIIKFKHFPNLLLHGPPGTGKTTTIINLVNSFHNDEQKTQQLVIHLNASDERGIDIIRNQIFSFVNSKSLFVDGIKIVILDEVDYMTKCAQQALRHVLHQTSWRENVRFCLICNYVTKIDESLQNEFVRLRFNTLPENYTTMLLNKINKLENINLKYDSLKHIQKLFGSDIRSMLNYMQCINDKNFKYKVINKNLWKKYTCMLKTEKITNKTINYLINLSKSYQISLIVLIKDYLNYIVRYEKNLLTENVLKAFEYIIHDYKPDFKYMNHYLVYKFNSEFKLINEKID